MMTSKKISYALISVSDKEGIVEFAKNLSQLNITLLSTGGSAALLKKNHIPVIDVSDFTGFPEMMGGRVKTLHPKLYGGILARTEDDELLAKLNIPRIDLVIVNLYPFEKTTAEQNCSFETAIENIDIGGPTLLRAAAKNFENTTAIVSKEDYKTVLEEIIQTGTTSRKTRFHLAKKVFTHITQYDAAISAYFSSHEEDNHDTFPETYRLNLNKIMDLRYGENPHQQAAFYTYNSAETGNIATAIQHSGKPLSYNNIADADCALECVRQFETTACVIVKHANPCAVSLGATQLDAYEKAFNADKTSAFGGIIAFNTLLEIPTLQKILANQFVEVIIAPDITPDALTLVKQKPNIRVLTTGSLSSTPQKMLEFKSINGGVLVQDKDNLDSSFNLEIATLKQPTPLQLQDLLFAWKVVRFVKSNAIVYARNKSTLGIGPGQMSRVFSSKIAALKAQEAEFSLQDAVMASDAFFPFRDSVDEAAELGISAIIQPGGSVRDNEVIEAANQHNIAMVFTHFRHFKH